jgi:hypothetical protein
MGAGMVPKNDTGRLGRRRVPMPVSKNLSMGLCKEMSFEITSQYRSLVNGSIPTRTNSDQKGIGLGSGFGEPPFGALDL